MSPRHDAPSSFGCTLARAAGLYVAGACYGLPNGALFPLVSLTLYARGGSDIFVGWVASAFFAGALLAAVSFATIVSRIGFRWALAIIALLGSASTLAFALPLPLEASLALRFLYGFAVGAFYLTVDAWIGGLSEIRNRGRLLGLSEALRMAFLSCGPLVLLINSGPLAFVAAGSLFALMLPAGLLTPEPAAPAALGRHATSLGFVWRHAAELGLVLSCGALFATFSSHGASYAERMGFAGDRIAYFNAGVYAAGALSLILLGALSDFLGRIGVLLAITLVALACGTVLALQTAPEFLLALPLAAAVQAAATPLWSLSLARIIDRISPRELVMASSSGLMAYNVGAMAVPPAAGRLMTEIGPRGLFVTLAAVLTFALALVLLALLRDAVRERTARAP